MSINERITQILKSQKEFTQKNLANYIGVAASTMNNWIKLGRSIPAEYIIPISEYLHVDVHYLLTGEELDQSSNSYAGDDQEWLDLIHKLPLEARYEFKGELKGYLRRIEETSATSSDGTAGKSLA